MTARNGADEGRGQNRTGLYRLEGDRWAHLDIGYIRVISERLYWLLLTLLNREIAFSCKRLLGSTLYCWTVVGLRLLFALHSDWQLFLDISIVSSHRRTSVAAIK